jgi:hypothetical protein
MKGKERIEEKVAKEKEVIIVRSVDSVFFLCITCSLFIGRK